MRGVWTVCKRELLLLAAGPTAAVALFSILALTWFGTLFAGDLLARPFVDIEPLFALAPLVVVPIAPALTMHLAGSRDSGMLERLLALPLSRPTLLLGHLLAAWLVLSAGLLATASLPAALAFLGGVDLVPLLGGYLGLLLLALAASAVSLLAATVTRSAGGAYLTGLLALLALWVSDKLAALVPAGWARPLAQLGTARHFTAIARGVLALEDLLYYPVLAAIALTLAAVRLHLERKPTQRRPVLLGLLICANLAAAWGLGARSGLRLDLSADQRYTLSQTSRELTRSLPAPVVVRAFIPGDLSFPYHDHQRQIRARLAEYAAASRGGIRVEMVDPELDPAAADEAERLGLRRLEYQSRTARGTERRSIHMGVALLMGDRVEVVPILDRLDDIEYQISRRLLALSRDRARPRIGILIGHGEIDLSAYPAEHPAGRLHAALADNYDLAVVELDRTPLDDLAALLVLGPRETLSRRSLFLLDQFLMSGRPIALFLSSMLADPERLALEPARHGADRLLAPWGLQFGSGVLIDRQNHGRIMLPARRGEEIVAVPVDSPLVPVVSDLPDHPLNRHLDALVMPFTAPLGTVDPPPEGIETLPLALASEATSYSEQLESLDPRVLREPLADERLGPWTAALTAEGVFPSGFAAQQAPAGPAGQREEVISRSPPGTRLLLVGSTEAALANPGLMAHGVDWLTLDPVLAAIRPRATAPRPLRRLTPAGRWLWRGGIVGSSLAAVASLLLLLRRYR